MQLPTEIPNSILITAAITYLIMGIGYTQMLRIHWQFFYKTTNKHPTFLILATFLWAAVFVVFITWRSIEPLTKNRKKDWDEI